MSTSWLYGTIALGLGATLLVRAHRLHRHYVRSEPAAPQRMFRWSVTYLSLLSAALTLDALTVTPPS